MVRSNDHVEQLDVLPGHTPCSLFVEIEFATRTGRGVAGFERPNMQWPGAVAVGQKLELADADWRINGPWQVRSVDYQSYADGTITAHVNLDGSNFAERLLQDDAAHSLHPYCDGARLDSDFFSVSGFDQLVDAFIEDQWDCFEAVWIRADGTRVNLLSTQLEDFEEEDDEADEEYEYEADDEEELPPDTSHLSN